MPKIKPKRKAPSIDMTAMVDVAFLLLTFFILTTKFKPDENVVVDTPKAAMGETFNESDFVIVTVNEKGQVFLSWKNVLMGRGMIDKIASDYNLNISENGKSFFAARSEFGCPFNQLPNWLNSEDVEHLRDYPQTGIPVDLTRGKTNELKEWLRAAKRASSTKLRFALKGDRETEFPVVDEVITTLQETGENKFYLVTSLESDPLAEQLKKSQASESEAEGNE